MPPGRGLPAERSGHIDENGLATRDKLFGSVPRVFS